MDAMSPGIRERKESKMPKEGFCKVSVHHKYVHDNGCVTLDYRLYVVTCTMLALGRLGPHSLCHPEKHQTKAD
jgi:hypothetical protein